MKRSSIVLGLALGIMTGAVSANEETELTPVERGEYGPIDKDTSTVLYERPIQITDRVYSAIGATQPETFENYGHNNNLTFVIGDEAVLMINGGSNDELAAAMHEEIKAITDLPVKYLVSENGQRHAVGGNHYWKNQGVELIGHVDAADEVEHYGGQYIEATIRQRQDENYPFTLVDFDTLMEDNLTLDLGGIEVEVRTYGPAHSPGDVSVVVPSDNLVIAGDLAFHIRMPPIFDETDTAGWVETWAVFEEEAGDMLILPGHGGPTDMATVRAGTYDYLIFLREQVQALLDEDGTLEDAYKIDQSAYAHWHTFHELAARNAGRVFTAMEFE